MTTQKRNTAKSDVNAVNTARTKRADKSASEKAVITLTTKQQEWRTRLFEAVADNVQTGVRLLDTVLEARRLKVPQEAVKQLVFEAYMATGKCTEATAKKRGSDAAALVKASALPKDLPGNLQRAADVTRKAERGDKGQQRAPRQPSGEAETKKAKPVSLASLVADIEQLRAELEDEDALSILADMADLANELADKLAIEAEAV